MEKSSQSRIVQIMISADIGQVSAIITQPEEMRFVLLLAHGAGAGMTHGFMDSLSSELAKVGIGNIRYNFPYMEQGRKRPDVASVAEKTVGAVIEKAIELFPTMPLLAGGKSFGGRMTSNYLSKNKVNRVKGIIFYGFPLHPARKPSVQRATHLYAVETPMLFLQGTKDLLAESSLIQQVVSKLPHATLTFFQGADHAFHVARQNLVPTLAATSLAWANSLNSE
jgi:predicted alpha/beta-hydrolase family hydrolase